MDSQAKLAMMAELMKKRASSGGSKGVASSGDGSSNEPAPVVETATLEKGLPEESRPAKRAKESAPPPQAFKTVKKIPKKVSSAGRRWRLLSGLDKQGISLREYEAGQTSKKRPVRETEPSGEKTTRERSPDIELTEKERNEIEAVEAGIRTLLDSVAAQRGEEPVLQQIMPYHPLRFDLEKTPSEAERAQRSEAEKEVSADNELSEFITATLSEGAELTAEPERRRTRKGEGRTGGPDTHPKVVTPAQVAGSSGRTEGRGSEEATSEFVALERTSTRGRAQEETSTRQPAERSAGVHPQPSAGSRRPQGSGAEVRKKAHVEEPAPLNQGQAEHSGETTEGLAKKVAEALSAQVAAAKKQKDAEAVVTKLQEEIDTLKKFLPTMMKIGQDQEAIKQSFISWDEDVKKREAEVSNLHTDMAKVTAEYEAVKNESLNLGKTISDCKENMLSELKGLAGRVEGLEDFRRGVWLSQGKEDVVDSNRLRREGFDFALDAIISRGWFPRRLLDDPTFMNLIHDKDGFIFKIEKAERERRGRFDDRGSYDRGQGSQSRQLTDRR